MPPRAFGYLGGSVATAKGAGNVWTRGNPFLTLRRILSLWERHVTALERISISLAGADSTDAPKDPTAAAAPPAVGWLDSVKRSLTRKLPEKPVRKRSASDVVHVDRASRLAYQIQQQGRKIHGDPPTP